jgi:hypothetical protein
MRPERNGKAYHPSRYITDGVSAHNRTNLGNLRRQCGDAARHCRGVAIVVPQARDGANAGRVIAEIDVRYDFERFDRRGD